MIAAATIQDWVLTLRGATIEVETAGGRRVLLCSSRAALAKAIKLEQVALSPIEIWHLICAGGGPAMLDAVAEIKRIDPAARVRDESEVAI